MLRLRFTSTRGVGQSESMATLGTFRLGLAVWAALCALPATAQDIAWTPEATETCLAEAAEPFAQKLCIGRSAATCIDTPDGYTTVGMSFCASQEAAYWDTRLNAAYGQLRDVEAAVDAELAALGSAAPSMSDALRQMQRAWIVYRDTTCAYEASQFGGGTGSGPATANCVMRLTGAQALDLENRLAQKTAP